jgi:hypothetical protein
VTVSETPDAEFVRVDSGRVRSDEGRPEEGACGGGEEVVNGTFFALAFVILPLLVMLAGYAGGRARRKSGRATPGRVSTFRSWRACELDRVWPDHH